MNTRNFRDRLIGAAAAGVLTCLSAQASAAPLNISDTPIFLATGVQPNLIMAIDDSGSMDFEVLLRGNDGAAWWRTNNSSGNCSSTTGNSFTGCIADGTTDQPGAGQLNFNNSGNSSGTWKKFAYLFPNGSGGDTSDRRRLGDGTNDHFAIPPLPQYGWSRSPEYNRAYFNPATIYSPWQNGGGFTFTDSTPTAARFDPVFSGAGTVDLTRDFAGTDNVDLITSCDSTSNNVASNYYFRVYTGMVIPANTCIRVAGRSNWETVKSTGSCVVGGGAGSCQLTRNGVNVTGYTAMPTDTSVAIRYFPATFYLSAANAPPASFGYTATPAADGRAPDGTVLYRYEIKPANFSNAATYTAAIQNFANWFSYYRKRHEALRAGLGQAFITLQGTRVAGFTINQSGSPSSPDVTMGSIDTAANRSALYTNFYQNWVHSGGTPNRSAVANLIRNYRRTDANAPITKSCQRNFGMLFTDGFSNPPASGDGIPTTNVDGGLGDPYQDDVSNTLADGVMSAYLNPLRTDVTQGKVKVPAACKDATHDPRLDCNTNPHMNFYAITLGTRGLQFNPDNPVDPYVSPPTWPSTFPARHPSAVDDLWHATINGRGQLLNASSSSDLADKLSSVLRSIADAVGSAASASVNSGSINSDTRLYQASFDSKDWSGKLLAYEVNPDGTLGTMTQGTIPAASTRQIITSNSDGSAVPFRWTSLDAARRGELDATADATTGAALVNYLRGDQTNEVPNGYRYRARKTSILGDVIDSSPTFVGSPSFRYADSLEAAPYSAFRSANLNRPHTVYVGANDGMLHAFHTEDAAGSDKSVTEIFAYVPSVVLRNMKKLSDPAYVHQFYVDGSPTVGDAYVGSKWRTMLAAGLNKGGQAIYALDITDPSAITESSAASVLHWEFTDADDPDLGFTYSRPQIVRMQNGKWAAIFGNGYNNTVADGNASTTGDAVLYIVDLETGELLQKIDTLYGASKDPKAAGRPNGLATPVVIDTNGDSIADIAYAGDLFGNLWKFDLSSANPSDWKVAYDNSGPEPLFVAKDASGVRQPITSRPNVSRGPNGRGFVVLFGTGKYLELSDGDVSTLSTQSFYGLFDANSGSDTTDVITDRSELTQQTITSEVLGATFGTGMPGDPMVTADVRVTSDNVVNSMSHGWYIDLVSPRAGFEGEMQVTDSIIRNGHIIYTTLIPNADPCENGGTSWLMEMNLFTGARLDNTPFDINNNGKFDDLLKRNGTSSVVTGLRSGVGIIPKGGTTSGEKCDYIIFPGSSGGTETRCRDPGVRGFGRQSWRQAR